MAELIGSLLILVGAFFLFSAGLGMLRMPDVYTRMQAGTKASTLGNMLVLAGLALLSSGLEPEARHRDLFRADDESDLVACAGARRPRHRHSDGGSDRRRCAARGGHARRERAMITSRCGRLCAMALLGLVFANDLPATTRSGSRCARWRKAM